MTGEPYRYQVTRMTLPIYEISNQTLTPFRAMGWSDIASMLDYSYSDKTEQLIKLLYELYELEDRAVFAANQMAKGTLVDNYRRTGRTTSKIIEAIAWALQGQTVCFICRDYNNGLYLENLLSRYCEYFENPSVRGRVATYISGHEPRNYTFNQTIRDLD